ncbi:MAG: hypothetical protein JKY60_13850 [Kordiimonadaceae bacterium]|nr:hypothetical protein [Kordiimonadaceae bacterium]
MQKANSSGDDGSNHDKCVDLVTVSYCDEIRMLQLQARSIRQHVDPDFVKNIYVISNDPYFFRFKILFYRHVIKEYGVMSARVQLINGKKMLHSFRRRGGWVRQQILKVLALKIIKSDHYLMLDTKNHFIRCYSDEAAFTPSGKMRIATYPLYTPFTQKFVRGCTLFGVQPTEADFTNAMPLSTPYLASKDLIGRMVKETERLLKTDFESAFIGSGPFTEFYLYYAYILSQRGLFDRWYSSERNLNVTFWNPDVETTESFESKMQKIDEPHICSMGLHKRYLKSGSPEMLDAIANVWRKADLVSTDEECNYFLTLPKKRNRLLDLIF